MFKKGTKLITKTPGSCSQRNDTGNDTNNVYPPQNNFTVAPTSLNTEDLIHQYFESKSDSHLTSKPNKQFPMHKLFYKEGEIVGAETRFLEFKQGRGSYMDRQLRDHVAKYICGFLNSEGGTLLIGVRDSGKVLMIIMQFEYSLVPTLTHRCFSSNKRIGLDIQTDTPISMIS